MGTTPQKSDIKFTYYDYTQLPEDKRYELIEGDFYMTPSATTRHQTVSSKLQFRLTQYVEGKNFGLVLAAPLDVVFSDEDVVQPDIIFISQDRKGIIKPENIRGAPDLVIEILSPATAARDLGVKKRLYAKHAVLEYWVVNPEDQTIEVMSWTEKGFKTEQVYPKSSALRSKILPDFTLPVGQIF